MIDQDDRRALASIAIMASVAVLLTLTAGATLGAAAWLFLEISGIGG